MLGVFLAEYIYYKIYNMDAQPTQDVESMLV